ncbi:MAG: discoidin domain-containing protein, partial [Armatimonadota bacterium]
MGASLRNGRVHLTADVRQRRVVVALEDRLTHVAYATGAYRHAVRLEGAGEWGLGLADPQIESQQDRIVVAGRIADFDAFRLVAVPYRRQCDGRLHDYSMKDVREGRFANSNWRNDPTVADQDVCDRGKLRSEGWSITDGLHGLLVIKYNPEHIEYSLAFPDGDELQFGGAGFALYREPRPATFLRPGESFTFGVTRYHAHDGGWPEAYRIFRDFMNAHGHGLTADYDPPVNWNELFDVGWYHSDREALFQHYTRDALLKEAAKAKGVGCELLYLDPGWEVCEGTTLWDTERLGDVQSFAEELRRNFGLALGLRTIGRVYRDEFPNGWYLRRKGQDGRYERPLLVPPVEAEPAPLRDDRGCRNLALLPGASVTASSVIPGYPDLHSVEHLCDGWYNNPASWISAKEPSWVEVDLGRVFTVDTVVLGSEHTSHYRDRAITRFNVEVSAEEPAEWRRVANYDGEPVRDTRAFRFQPLKARRIRVNILRTDAGDQARI